MTDTPKLNSMGFAKSPQDTRVVVAMSGGVDSSVVAGLLVEKARAVAQQHPNHWVISGDTVVAVGNRILGKPADGDQSRTMLALLSGRRHAVYGGVCIITPDGKIIQRAVKTSVVFKRLTEREITDYIATSDCVGKAGSYAIQGYAGAFVRNIIGSYSNVVGLDLFSVRQILTGNGYRV